MKKKSNDKEGYNNSENKIKLTVYKNGFQIDEGPKYVKGYIPQELVDQGFKNLAIALMDKK